MVWGYAPLGVHVAQQLHGASMVPPVRRREGTYGGSSRKHLDRGGQCAECCWRCSYGCSMAASPVGVGRCSTPEPMGPRINGSPVHRGHRSGGLQSLHPGCVLLAAPAAPDSAGARYRHPRCKRTGSKRRTTWAANRPTPARVTRSSQRRWRGIDRASPKRRGSAARTGSRQPRRLALASYSCGGANPGPDRIWNFAWSSTPITWNGSPILTRMRISD
jgi:hypothetical protein